MEKTITGIIALGTMYSFVINCNENVTVRMVSESYFQVVKCSRNMTDQNTQDMPFTIGNNFKVILNPLIHLPLPNE
jgi:hypothetical protein